MTKFKLYKKEEIYTLKCNGNVLISKRINSELEAIEYFKAWISSWGSAHLILEFKPIATNY